MMRFTGRMASACVAGASALLLSQGVHAQIEVSPEAADPSSAAAAPVTPAPEAASTAEPAPALSADAPASEVQSDAAADSGKIEEVVVTGSRVIKNGNASPSPVTVMSTEESLRVSPGNLSDSLSILPVFAGSRGAASNPSSTGSAAGGNGNANQLNLRNLGPNRTLILMDGLRVPPTTFNGIVDVDLIPQMLIQRVDTVTGGVSAVYGSDAVAGVVNYIIDRKFNGVKAQISQGLSQEDDGEKFDVALAGGTNLFSGRGHLEGSVEYRDEKGVLRRSDRDFLDQWGVTGSGTADNPYRLQKNVRQAGFPFGGLITNGALAGQTFGTNGTLRPFVAGQSTDTSALQIGGDGGYYDSSLLAPLEATQLFGRFDYDLTDDVRAYVQVGANLKTNQGYSDYVKLSNVTMDSANAFLPADYQAQLATAGESSFKFSELMQDAPRLHSISDSDQWVYMAGLQGSLGAYNWGLNLTHGTTSLHTDIRNNVNNQRLAAALDAVIDPGTGQPACYVTLNTPAQGQGCVPLNVFGPTAAGGNDALDYVLQTTHYAADTEMNDASAHIEGSPFNTWAGPFNLALSGEARKLSFRSSVRDGSASDTVDCTGLRYNCKTDGPLWINSFAGSPKVSQTVWEVATEFEAPLVVDVPAIQSLSLNGAARYTSYDTSGDYWTWKVGIDWQIVDSFRIRATRSRDIRAPTLYELFAPTNSVSVNPVDLQTGASPQVPQTDLSNPDLTAEIGNTTTAGFVWNPLPRLSVALDGYHITISDAVVQIAGSTTANQQACIDDSNSPWCALQERDASGNITRWYTKYYNIAEIETFGADLEINYGLRFLDRPASLRLLTAYQPHSYYRQPGTQTTDQGGVAFGPLGLGASPAVRLTGLARFQPLDNFTVDIMERWRSAMKLGGDPSQVWVHNHIASFATTNLTLTYAQDAGFGMAEVFLNVSNLFDAEPPGGGYSGNGTRAGLRDGFALGDDVMGRYFTAGIRLRM